MDGSKCAVVLLPKEDDKKGKKRVIVDGVDSGQRVVPNAFGTPKPPPPVVALFSKLSARLRQFLYRALRPQGYQRALPGIYFIGVPAEKTPYIDAFKGEIP